MVEVDGLVINSNKECKASERLFAENMELYLSKFEILNELGHQSIWRSNDDELLCGIIDR